MIDSLLIVVIDHGPAGGSRIAAHSIMLPIKRSLRNMCVVEINGFLPDYTSKSYTLYIVLTVGNGQQGQCMRENNMKEQQHSLMSRLGAPNPRICSRSIIQPGRNRRCKSNAQSGLGQV